MGAIPKGIEAKISTPAETPESQGKKVDTGKMDPNNVPTKQAKQLQGAFKIPDAHKTHLATPQSGLKQAPKTNTDSTKDQYGESNVTISPDSTVQGNTGISFKN
ncbi:MAG: hypothetical protein N4A38_02055 [Candidatus Gracilibacteria bacterium]|nr:hypothetical protein [Candidatus Gracilibacteria bacterium]